MKLKQCQGCGAQIQSTDPAAYGFVPETLLERKPLLCQRCFRINHYGLDELGPVQAQTSLTAIRAGLAWATGVVLVVDLMDFEAGLPRELLGLIGDKPVLFVVNKVDLLPEQTTIIETENWCLKRLAHYGVSASRANLILVSAVNGYGFPALADRIGEIGPQVLFAGVTNVGKSSVLQRLLQMRIGGGRRRQIKPTISPYPGTTVEVSKWHCPDGLIMADSPGYVPRGRISDMVAVDCARDLIPHKQLTSHLYPVQQGDLVLIPGLCGVECIGTSGDGLLLGFTGSGVKWQKSSSRHLAKWLYDYAGSCKVEKWQKKEVKLAPGQDLTLSGLGWVSARNASFKLLVHLPQNAQLTIRPNLIGRKTF